MKAIQAHPKQGLDGLTLVDLSDPGEPGPGAIRVRVRATSLNFHARLVENLDEGRVRILTHETQNGAPAKDLATTWPNPMLNGHQEWLDVLTAAAHTTGGGGR